MTFRRPQLRQIAASELGEFLRLMGIPLPQFGRRRNVTQPLGQVERVFSYATWPDAVDQHPCAVGWRNLVVNPAIGDVTNQCSPHINDELSLAR